MSVINKMLKDIEHRENNESVYLDPTVKVKNISNYTQVLQRVVLLVITIGIAIGAYWLIPTKPASEPVKLVQNVMPEQPKNIQVNASKSKNENSNLDKRDQLNSSQVDALEQAEARIKKLEADIAEKEKLAVEKIAKPRVLVSPVEEVTPKKVELAKEKPINVEEQVKAVAKIRKISTRERAENWFRQGKEAFQFGLIEDAIAALDKTLILMPLHIEARSLLAAAYYGREQTQEAESTLRHGLSLNPDVMRWRILLAKILVEKGNYQSVEPVLSKRYETSANVDFWILKGTAAQQLGEHRVAENCFRKLTQLEPAEAKWWLALATSSDALGNYHNAKRFYLTAIELGGLSPNAHNHAKQRLAKIGLL